MDAGRRGGPVLSAYTLNSPRVAGLLALLLVVSGTLLAPTALAQPRPGQEHRPRHLTAPSSRDALEIGADYLREHVAGMGLADDDLDELQVMDRFVTRQTGMTHLHLRQHVRGSSVSVTTLNVTSLRTPACEASETSSAMSVSNVLDACEARVAGTGPV